MEHFLWVEKYRPKTVDETILPKFYKEAFKSYLAQGNIPNLILAGSPGIGKTTVAKAMVEELGSSYMILNGSLEANKDSLRNEIKDFASSTSMKGGRKYVILDEADHLTHHIQPALRNFMEEFSANCGFILTCNYKHRIIEPLHSRCSLVEFKFTKEEKNEIIKQVYMSILNILNTEGVEYDKQVIAEVIKKYFPDLRKMINELQKYSVNGKIDSGVLTDFDEVSLKQLLGFIKENNFNQMRDWVAHTDVDQQEIYHKLYEVSSKYFTPASAAQLILILADYQDKATRAVNPDINLMACLVEMAVNLDFKE